MRQKSPSKHSRVPLYCQVAVLFLLLSGATIFILEKNGLINLYTKPMAKTTVTQPAKGVPSANPTNTVNYSPATSSDNQPVPAKDPSTTTPQNSSLSATITRTTKSSDGSNFLIKVAVLGTTQGGCEATMKNGDVLATSQGIIELSGGQYGCSGLSIPLSKLNSPGSWQLTVKVTDSTGATDETSKEVTL
jgi:hypothetical protein